VKRTDPAFITLHDCHHHFWIAGADCQTDPASLPWKTAAEFFPRSSTVGALENSTDIFAAGHARAGGETPRRPLPRIQRCVNSLRIRRVKRDFPTACVRVVRRRCVKDQYPSLARHRGLKQSAITTVL